MSDAEAETTGNGESLDLSKPDVTTKYRTAADIVNAALQEVAKQCVHGGDIATICRSGDSFIEEKTAVLYNKKKGDDKIKKGVAFPTCISVNEVCGHYSPLSGDSKTLVKGDLVKIDLGAHIDGFIALGGHTLVVGEEATGRKALVMKAAEIAAEAALKSLKVGNTNTDVTKAIALACQEFKCNAVQGIHSHQLKQHVIDGSQCIVNRETAEDKVDEFTFAPNEVYVLDVMVSSGEGKTRESEARTTVYKRLIDRQFGLRSNLARKFLAEIGARFTALPFTIAAIDDEKTRLVGVMECMRNELLQPYPVMTEKPGEFVAQFKFTVLLLPGGTKKITGLPYEKVTCDVEIQSEDLLKLLATCTSSKKKKKKDKKISGEGADIQQQEEPEASSNAANATSATTNGVASAAV